MPMIPEIDETGIDPFDAPIPGESLTGDPQDRKPWEKPPEFVEVEPAIQQLFLDMTDPVVYPDLMQHIRDRIPLTDLAQVILFKGYMEGRWSTDLMLLMAEPLIYLLAALAEKNKFYDYLIYDDEETDLDDEEIGELLNDDLQRISPKKSKLNQAMNKKKEDVLSDSLLSRVDAVQPVAAEGEE
jgi:hypothetical protein